MAMAGAAALLAAALAVAAGLPGARGAEVGSGPPGPFILPQWSATLRYRGSVMGMNLSHGRGMYYYDGPGQRYRFNFSAGISIFYPDGHMEEDRLYANGSGCPSLNFTVNGRESGVCMPFKAPFSDPFAWAAGATTLGTRELAGRECRVWTRLVEKTEVLGPQVYNMTACVAAGGVPLELLVSALGHGKMSGDERFRFSDMRAGPPEDRAFENPEVCRSWPPPPCRARGASALDVYRIFGPPEPQELANRDGGDALGVLSFLCTQGSGRAYQGKLVARWRVLASNAFGPYALCNFNGTANVCGPPGLLLPRRVGRRASQGQTHHPAGGQCSPNSEVGSQFSFPGAALCAPGRRPSARGCGFAEPVAVKTVRASCLFLDRGLLEACREDFGHAPFATSRLIFQAAFASDDPARGGCPRVEPAADAVFV